MAFDNAFDDWINTGYDETGDDVSCDICEGTMMWDPDLRLWTCSDCGRQMNRAYYFNYIGAEPPNVKCLTNCHENYPLCKQYCPMLNKDIRDAGL